MLIIVIKIYSLISPKKSTNCKHQAPVNKGLNCKNKVKRLTNALKCNTIPVKFFFWKSTCVFFKTKIKWRQTYHSLINYKTTMAQLLGWTMPNLFFYVKKGHILANFTWFNLYQRILKHNSVNIGMWPIKYRTNFIILDRLNPLKNMFHLGGGSGMKG